MKIVGKIKQQSNTATRPRLRSSIAMDTGGKAEEETVRELRQCFKTGRTRSVTWRKKQLKALLDLVHDNEDAIFEALYQDLGKHPVEAYRDEVNHH